MKILVCFEINRDLESVMESDWNSAKTPDFNIDYTKKVCNCFDECALATAHHIKQEDSSVRIDAVTISRDTEFVASFAKNMYALGFEHVWKFDLEVHDTILAAQLFARHISCIQYDAIFIGQQSSPDDKTEIPLLIAEMLHIPCFTSVVDVKLADSQNGFLVCAENEYGMRETTLTGPAVYAFTNSYHAYLNMPTLREKLRVKDKTVIELLGETINARETDTILLSYSREKRQRHCEMLDCETSQKSVEELISRYILHLGQL